MYFDLGTWFFDVVSPLHFFHHTEKLPKKRKVQSSKYKELLG
jgi:hypothetical protein